MKSYTIRLDDIMLDKLHVISSYEGRSANGQITVMVRDLIEAFEAKHGEIKIERNTKKK